MTINLDEITRALAEATPVPWKHVKRIEYDTVSHYVCPTDIEVWVAKCGSEKYYSDKDAHLIANAPEWLRLLVERVRKYERLEETVMAFLDLQHNMAPYGHMIDEMYKDIAALAKESTT